METPLRLPEKSAAVAEAEKAMKKAGQRCGVSAWVVGLVVVFIVCL